MEKKLKKCDICKKDAACLCYKCMSYFCIFCFKIAHNNEENKLHKNYKIDYFAPINLKCSKHKLYPMGLFCINEKGTLKLN